MKSYTELKWVREKHLALLRRSAVGNPRTGHILLPDQHNERGIVALTQPDHALVQQIL